MNVIKKIINILTLYFMAISCVGDDGLFEKEIASLNMTKSITIVTVLHNLRITEMANEEELCFRFDYPLSLGYNTGASISISDFKGFKEMVFSQTPSFNVSKINFPFTIRPASSDLSIEVTNEKQFNTLISECNFKTLRKEVDRSLNICFDYNYPITLLDTSDIPKNIPNQVALTTFLTNQGEDYQPHHEFPIEINILSTKETKKIHSYFELFNILNSCNTIVENCPEATLVATSVTEDQNEFTFKTTTLPEASYEWYLNDQLLPDQTTSFYRAPKFTPGDYEIRVIITYNREECIATTTSASVKVTALEACPEISYMKTAIDSVFLLAEISEPNTDDRSYIWLVDNVIIDPQTLNPNPNDQSDRALFLPGLEDGTHEICVKSKSIYCNSESIYCDKITVDYCPEPTFTSKELGAATGTYLFEATFPERTSVVYKWVVDGVDIENDGGIDSNLDSSALFDNKLEFTFDQPGTHSVCISVRNAQPCIDATECMDIDVVF